ncbi:MASE3 domain-containing protein [Geobacter sp. AOG2]|uniref:MASE3 domain-containing protein n=1 Tax=Geobacter sp. AOG2 TaxID=1566347 RepID=UPI001CC5EDCB|nr:MASE3 domain-containing protein [Geobacter sp. AOG2]GFE62924.1 hypothetical protein AOG2_35130 [Geobacter sp. AOG2]
MENTGTSSIGHSKQMYWVFICAVIVGLYLTTKVNYLLFHSIIELFSIVIASTVFIITWNSVRYIKNPYLITVGISCIFVAALDLLHTLSYKGMPIFTDYDYYANQLWIAARYLESITMLSAFILLKKGKNINYNSIFMGYLCITGLLIASIFYWKIFPVCFVEGQGLTEFKIYSEYIICAILVASIAVLMKNKMYFTGKVYKYILLSILYTIVSEVAFTFYSDNYGISNLVGHYLKFFAFLMTYHAIVTTGIEDPYRLIFNELSETNGALNKEIELRKGAQSDLEDVILSLKNALDEIRTLKGIIPICSFCKKIRKDEKSWQQLETYLSEHSEAQFSHGVCPDCYDEQMREIREQAAHKPHREH